MTSLIAFQGSPMSTNYEKIIFENLIKIRGRSRRELELSLPAVRKDEHYFFRAFGEDCTIGPDQITLSGRPDKGPQGVLLSLYSAHVTPETIRLEPYLSFKDFPGSMPYHGAFGTNSERVLIPYAQQIKDRREHLIERFEGRENPPGSAGDFALLLYPLPKIALCYIFYMPDEEFPASVTCLFSADAGAFMPLDGLADIAEYTSKAIIRLVQTE